MRKFSVRFILIVLFALLSGFLPAATMHFIVTADTGDSSIGDSVKSDVVNMTNLSKNIAANTGMTLNFILLRDSDYHFSKLDPVINSLKVSADDTVFFYDSSHGYRTQAKQNEWPYIYMKTSDGKTVDLYEVYTRLIAKKARLTIVMGDLCNSFIDRSSPQILKSRGINPNITANLKHLFLYSKGQILATSSKPGETSGALNDGGTYTLAWFAALNSALEADKKASWRQVFEVASRVMNPDSGRPQSPIYKIFSLTDSGAGDTNTNVVINPNTPAKLMTFNIEGGVIKQADKYNWNLSYKNYVYKFKAYREPSNQYHELYDAEFDDYYTIDLLNKMILYWDKKQNAWTNWKKLLEPGQTTTATVAFTLDGGKLVKSSTGTWVLSWDGNVYNLEFYKYDQDGYQYLYDAANDDWYILDIKGKSLYYFDKDTDQWGLWRKLTSL